MLSAHRIALRIAAAYLVVGVLWILLSDQAVEALFSDPRVLSQAQTYKGWFYVLVTAVLLYFLVRSMARRLQQAQAARAQLEKMEALGRMAAGVAHDFRNYLSVGTVTAELVGQQLPGGHPAQEHLRALVESSERGQALVSRLMDFARGREQAPQPVDLLALLQGLEPLLRKVLPSLARLELDLGSQPQCILADPVQMEQLLMNLVGNAADAFSPGQGDPLLRIRLRGQDGRVRLSVSDNGSGMSPEVQSHAFEPFFTTKGPGKGTGLGLATVFRAVQGNGGRIRIESAPGEGTVFKMDFPACDKA